jgi:hypothetical protein
MENTESILEAARKALGVPLNENTIDIVKKVATLNIGDNTNFGRVLEIGTNSITFKAKDLPKTKITFNQRKIGSSDFVLSALTKLNEARGYKSLTPAVLIDELQSIIDLPDAKLTDVTNISFRVSREEYYDRYPEIYKLLQKMYDAVMKPNGAKETKKIAQKAIDIVRSKYPNPDKYQRMRPVSSYNNTMVSESYTSVYLTEMTRKSYGETSAPQTVTFKERMKPKTIWQLTELRNYGL